MWFLPPPGYAGKVYKYRGRLDIANPRSKRYNISLDKYNAFQEAKYLESEWEDGCRHELVHYDSYYPAKEFVFTNKNFVVELPSPHWWIVIFLVFCTFWFITAFFAGYKDVWLGFMAIALCITLLLFCVQLFTDVSFVFPYFFGGLILNLTLIYLVPQFIYCYEWLVFITFFTIGAFVWSAFTRSSMSGVTWSHINILPLLWLVPLALVPMTYVYTILANDVVIPKFDPETEEWPDIEVQGGQVEEVKLIRQILHEMSRITKLRKMIAEMEIWDAFKKEDLPPEDEDKEKNLDVVFAGAADDPNNPFPHIDDTEVEVATKRAEEAEGNVRYEASQGWQASLGEKKRLKFIDTKIAEFEKELLVAPTEELRVAYQEKIDVLRRKRLHESIDDLRYAKSNLEHRMIHGLQEPSYSDFIEHAQQTTTLDVRIKSRERRLELTAESPLALGDGSGTSKGGALQLTRVKDVKLYDDETVEAAKKSEDYIQMKQTMEAILNEKKNPYKEFKGTKEEFNQVGDDKFSETVTPQAKLLAYAKGWDLFTQQEKEQMQNMNVWPPETIQWNQIKKRYEKKNQDE